MVIRFSLHVEEFTAKEAVTRVKSFRDHLLNVCYDYGDFLVDSEPVNKDEMKNVFNQLIDYLEKNSFKNKDGELIVPGIDDKYSTKDSGDIELGQTEFENSICLQTEDDDILIRVSMKLQIDYGFIDDFDGDAFFEDKGLGFEFDMYDNEDNYKEGSI